MIFFVPLYLSNLQQELKCSFVMIIHSRQTIDSSLKDENMSNFEFQVVWLPVFGVLFVDFVRAEE